MVSLVGLLVLRTGRAEAVDDQIAALRAGFAEVGRREIALAQVPKDQWHSLPDLPNPYAACLPLLKAPPVILAAAIDEGIRVGTREERIGALEVYQLAVSPEKRLFPLREEYQGLLIEFLKKDDLRSVPYTGVLLGTLHKYRSRETVLAEMDAASRCTVPEIRERLIVSAASMLKLEIPIYKQTTPLEKERVLADLESWLNRNRDKIRVNGRGELYVAAGGTREGNVELSAEDRGRIRKDPVCVLKLIGTMMEGGEEGPTMELIERCGEALLGAEGVSLLRKSAETLTGEGPSLDLQAAMASARAKYPTMDAVQLAIAYVAAYETDSAALSLARETLDELGTPDMARVLKGEPREVRKKARELAKGDPDE